MADRGKGIPLEKRINISGKMGRAVFAVTAVTAAVFWLSGQCGGHGGAGTEGRGTLWRRASDHQGRGDGRGRGNPGTG
ncbi:MAG: hypothetical protein ACLTBV_10930 [Enterocloster bolteae]